jgi:hypothetical protein
MIEQEPFPTFPAIDSCIAVLTRVDNSIRIITTPAKIDGHELAHMRG